MAGEALLERDGEVAVLRAGIDAVLAGSDRFLVLSGEAGVGKTRLLAELQRLATERGVRVLAARGSELEREYGFGVVRQLFEPLLSRADERRRAEWLSGAAGAAAAVLDGAGGQPAAGAPGGFAVLNGLFWLTSNVCQSGPAVLVVDDLHWADEPSLRMLAFLLPRLEDLALLVVAAMRPAEPGAPARLLDVITTDPDCRLLPLAPLSAAATARFLAGVLDRPPEEGFADACHRATGGNPLLVAELARAVAVSGLAPTAANTAQVQRIGSRAVARRVSLHLGRLPEAHVRLAEAVAVLGADADLGNVAAVAGLPVGQSVPGLADLESVQLVRVPAAGTAVGLAPRYEFVHPLIRAAVYDRLGVARRLAYHTAAARLLADAGARPEQVAAHLLHLPPAGSAAAVDALRRAAAEAMSHGAPESALTYLRRALAEPPPADQRLALLTDAGLAALPVDMAAASDYLGEALTVTADPRTRAALTAAVGLSMLYVERVKDAVDVLTDTIRRLPPDADDLSRSLEAILLDVPMIAAGWESITLRVPRLRTLPRSDGLGARQLDCMIAGFDCQAGDPSTVDLVRQALADPKVAEIASQGVSSAIAGYFVLAVADLEAGVAAHDNLITMARTRGSPTTLCAALTYRGMGWLRRGELAEAESDLREGLRLAELTHLAVAVPVISAFLTETLVDQGRLTEAAASLERAAVPAVLPQVGLHYFHLQARSRLLAAQGRPSEALDAATSAGRRFAEHGGDNPAVVAWRSQAALCLHELGRQEEAIAQAEAGLVRARCWGSGYAIGHALRVAGLVTPGTAGLDRLEEAVRVLRPSPALLEYARAEVDLGSVHLAAGRRTDARAHLAAGLDQANRCGAAAVVERARAGLRAAGARPRRPSLSGASSLTPSEARVAQLAVQQLTNRQIAQQLFVTAKTVEVHLSAVYRKLGATRRDELADKLAGALAQV